MSFIATLHDDPSCSLVFEAEREEANVMKRAPRSLTRRGLVAHEHRTGAAAGVVNVLVVCR
jgi:hypothetical protein